ncbi:hypothetical protein KPL70_005626 [Citrus sinensis]|uniref:Growth-regulating factor n=2 Tax=Citrus TaxID=2706 RepID=V4TGH0_CITCL|nr:growth-regulating factor 7 isoform X1 [Citrus x clementina]XP_052294727.1 growth-regulating factor 7-like isoform X1 [Citrus sinensis]ESR52452.1 hypothetical protein CICLE_v10019828mg [Citrus x clementina]KAH9718908.1 hypothetical protein KPL70_005626 [Citrus sinensis]
MQESSSCSRSCSCTTSTSSSSSSAVNYDINNNNNYQSPQLLLSSSSTSCEILTAGGGASGCGGSILCNASNQVACMSDIYDVVGAASRSGTNSAAAVLASKSLSPPSITDSFFHFNSSASASASGEMAAAAAAVNLRLAFTAAQLQELERQTLIYKYMMASAPIPHELLLPITKSPSTSRVLPSCQPNMVQGSMELRLLSNNSSSDPEPWRCRRTDGKKWRCSRDVAPEQKYCERHSHKSRPRSRKPVELPAHRGHNSSLHQSVHNSTLNKSYPKYMASSIALSEQQEQPRSLEWFMKGETMPVASNSNQEWLQNTSKYGGHHHHHKEHLINSNNLSGDDLAFDAQRLHDQYSLLLSPKMVSHHAQQTQETRHFIDAWSLGLGGENMADEDGMGSTSNCFVSSNEKLPLSSLTLSMSGGNETIERNENALMASLGTMGSERENAGALRPHWMNHVSGMGSPPGGPLAEVLCLGTASSVKSDSNAASPHGCSTSTTTSS